MKNKRYRNSDYSNRYQDNENYRQSNDWNDDVNNYNQNYRDSNGSNFSSPGYYDSNKGSSRRYDDYNRSQYQSGNRNENENWLNNNYGRNDYGSSGYGPSAGYGQSNRNDWNSNRDNDYSTQYPSYRNDYDRNRNRNSNDYNRYSNNPQDRGWWDKTKDEVSSWFGDDDAQRRRRMDEAREGNHKGKGPKNYNRSPERIKEDINDKLSDDWMVDASEIEVNVAGTEVTLTGSVNSKEAKRRAEDCADSVSGVTHVQNNLRVNSLSSTDLTAGKTTPATTEYSARTRKETMNHN